MRWTKWKEYLPFFIYWNVFALANRSLLNSRKLLFNPLSANPTKWPNTLKQSDLLTNCLRVLDHFVKLALTGLTCPMILHKFTKSHIYHKVYIFPNCLVSRFSGVHLEPSERSKMKLTVWKVSKYGVISRPYFPALGLNTEINN